MTCVFALIISEFLSLNFSSGVLEKLSVGLIQTIHMDLTPPICLKKARVKVKVLLLYLLSSIYWMPAIKTSKAFPVHCCVHLFHQLKTKDSFKNSFLFSSFKNSHIDSTHHSLFGYIDFRVWCWYKVIQIRVGPRGTNGHWFKPYQFWG